MDAVRRRDVGGMVHLPLQPVHAGEGRSYVAHLQHARARHAARVEGGPGLRKRAAAAAAAAAATSNADGFSTKALKAAIDNSVTAPDGKPGKNSLGLSIEGPFGPADSTDMISGRHGLLCDNSNGDTAQAVQNSHGPSRAAVGES